MDMQVTRRGERGQIVIPQFFRESLGLQKGSQFIIVERNGALVLKKIQPPSEQEFDALMARTTALAAKHHLTKKDVLQAIQITRKTAKK